MALSPQELRRITQRGVNNIIVREEFVKLLQEGKPLRLKMGFDPSRPDIHLGHVVGLRKLRQLQDLGHRLILIVGDWTAQIGDPSGRSATRPMLTHDEVMENAQSYLRQFFKVVDRDRAQVVYQSEWFGKFSLADVIGLTGRFTVAQFLERDDFATRFAEHRPIAITELLYPLLQAYDSVAIESDVEFGGTDQMFNLLVGRELQGMMGQRPQQCFLMPILVGTDGVQKMSKSLDNYVGVEEPPDDMFGKIMSLPDNLIVSYFDYLTDSPDEELEEMTRSIQGLTVNPMDLKKRLAQEITEVFHDRQAATAARERFERVGAAALPARRYAGRFPVLHHRPALEQCPGSRRLGVQRKRRQAHDKPGRRGTVPSFRPLSQTHRRRTLRAPRIWHRRKGRPPPLRLLAGLDQRASAILQLGAPRIPPPLLGKVRNGGSPSLCEPTTPHSNSPLSGKCDLRTSFAFAIGR